MAARHRWWSERSFAAYARASLAPILALVLTFLAVLPASAGDGTWTRVGSLSKTPNAQLAVDPKDPDRFIAAKETWGPSQGLVSRVYTSSDRGKTWDPLTCDIDNHVQIVWSDPEVVYAIYGFYGNYGEGYKSPDRNAVCADVIKARGRDSSLSEKPGIIEGQRLYRSGDGGKTWTLALGEGEYRNRFAISPQAPNVVYAVTDQGKVRKSVDRGKSWSVVSVVSVAPESPMGTAIAVHPTDPNLVLVGGDKGVFRSADGGGSWRQVSGVSTKHLAFTDSSGSAIAVTEGGTQLSTDGGNTWQPSDPRLGLESMIVNPLVPRELFAVDDKGAVLRSTDGGRTSSQLGSLVGGGNLAIDQANPQTLYLAKDDGLWAYTFSAKAAGLPKTGDPLAEVLPILTAAAVALSLAGLGLRKRSSTEAV